MKSKYWLNRNKKDIYIKRAKESGYLSRSAFKLIEINQKFKFIQNSKKILEIGSSPGGWSQVVFEINPNVKMYAIDILEMNFQHKNLKFIKEDFTKFDFKKNINEKFDLIISDIAPNSMGHKSTDHLRISNLINIILNHIQFIVLPSSNLVFKIWKGSEEESIINFLKNHYRKISYFKPKSSRTESAEIFIIAENYFF